MVEIRDRNARITERTRERFQQERKEQDRQVRRVIEHSKTGKNAVNKMGGGNKRVVKTLPDPQSSEVRRKRPDVKQELIRERLRSSKEEVQQRGKERAKSSESKEARGGRFIADNLQKQPFQTRKPVQEQLQRLLSGLSTRDFNVKRGSEPRIVKREKTRQEKTETKKRPGEGKRKRTKKAERRGEKGLEKPEKSVGRQKEGDQSRQVGKVVPAPERCIPGRKVAHRGLVKDRRKTGRIAGIKGRRGVVSGEERVDGVDEERLPTGGVHDHEDTVSHDEEDIVYRAGHQIFSEPDKLGDENRASATVLQREVVKATQSAIKAADQIIRLVIPLSERAPQDMMARFLSRTDANGCGMKG